MYYIVHSFPEHKIDVLEPVEGDTISRGTRDGLIYINKKPYNQRDAAACSDIRVEAHK